MKLIDAVHRRWVVGRRLAALERTLAPLLPEGAVLDVGSGSGLLALRLAVRTGVEIEGVDILVQPDAAIAVRPYDGKKLPFEKDSFAAVLMSDVLHHAEDPAHLLREAHRIAPIMILKDHLASGPLSRARLEFMDHVGNDRYGIEVRANYWTRAEWQRELAAASWRVDTWNESLGLYPFPFSIVFDASLHFVARLERSAD